MNIANQFLAPRQAMANMNHQEEPLRILLVDNEEVTRRSIGAFLSELGYDVLIAQNGEQAV